MQKMPDSQIVLLFLSRSETAIAESSRQYGRMLHSISRSLLGSDTDAEECVNDALFAAWRNIPPDRPQYLGAYLARLVRNISIDRFRRNGRQKRGGAGMVVEELSECIPSPDSIDGEVDSRMISACLNAFLAALPTEKRIIFTKRYFLSASVAEISWQMDIGEGKIKTVLYRLREQLKRKLKKEGLL